MPIRTPLYGFCSRDSRLSPAALAEKGRLPLIARQALIEALDDPAGACALVPLDRLIAEALQFVERSEVPDLPDRIVAATALALEVPLISRDRKIRASQLRTIW